MVKSGGMPAAVPRGFVERIVTLISALDAFLVDLTLEGRSPQTVRTYRSLLTPICDEKDIITLTAMSCRQQIAERLQTRSRATARTFTSALASFTAFMHTAYGITDAMADVPLPKEQERPHNFLSREELQAMWGACPDDSYRLMFLLLCQGLRASEICSLGAVSGDTVQIRGKGGKHRRIALPEAAIALLARYGPPAYSTERLRMRVRRLAKLAQIRRRVHPHMFRHSFASHALMEGMDTETLRTLGGWSDKSKMMEHYTRSVREQAALKNARAFDLTSRLLGE